MRNIINYSSDNTSNSCDHYQNFPKISNSVPLRRNSYQMAINTSKQDHLEYFYSTTSSISSIIDHISTTRSLCAMSDGCSYCVNDYIQQSTSQPAIRSLDNDLLLENATSLLDSPVHAFHPAHHKPRRTSNPNTIIVNEAPDEMHNCLNLSTLSIGSLYRIVFLRSFASALVLACLFSIEVLQTSIYSMEYSFQSLLTLHLSSSISAFILSAYTSHIHINRFRWKISDVLTYDRCSQILIVFSTLFTSTWIIIQYFYSFYHLVIVSAIVTGISLSFMIIKTYDHLLQLSATVTNDNIKLLTKRIHIFLCIYNCVCHLALFIGGICLLIIILLKQWQYKYILIGSQSCLLIPCLQLISQHDDSKEFFKPLSQLISRNLTMYLTENKQGKFNFEIKK